MAPEATTPKPAHRPLVARFLNDERAAGGLPNFAALALGLVGLVLAAVVGMVVLDALAPTYFDSFTTFLATLAAVTTGNALADAIIGILIIVVAVVGPLGFLGVAVAALALKARGKSS